MGPGQAERIAGFAGMNTCQALPIEQQPLIATRSVHKCALFLLSVPILAPVQVRLRPPVHVSLPVILLTLMSAVCLLTTAARPGAASHGQRALRDAERLPAYNLCPAH